MHGLGIDALNDMLRSLAGTPFPGGRSSDTGYQTVSNNSARGEETPGLRTSESADQSVVRRDMMSECPGSTVLSTKSSGPYKCGICSSKSHNNKDCTEWRKLLAEKRKRRAPKTHPADDNPSANATSNSPHSSTVGIQTRPHACTYCTWPCHNPRTCPVKAPGHASLVSNVKPVSKSVQCSACHKTGHRKNSLKCTLREPREFGPTCGICNEIGHNRTSCPLK